MDSFDQNRFIEFLILLAETPGPTFGEAPRRKILEDYFLLNNIDFSKDVMGNLLVEFKKGKQDHRIVFDAHIDVVQKGFADKVQVGKERLTGAGICDNLSAVAMMAFMAIFLKKNRRRMHRSCCFLFSVSEEGSGNLAGVKQYINDHPVAPELFVALDLSFDEYSVSALGSVRYRIKVVCQGGHSYADAGKPSAIDVIIDIYALIKKAFNAAANKEDRIITFNAGEIKGGEGINSIAANAELTFEFRSDSPIILDDLANAVSEIVSRVNNRAGIKALLDITGKRAAAVPVQPEKIEPVVKKLILSETGIVPESVIRSTSINATLDNGWPSVCLGLCSGGNYHRNDEFVETASLTPGWNLFLKLVDTLVLSPEIPVPETREIE
jgi:acetylornithine deacetylase/succinyl-diaminopimelate desuccinylase-like protein